MSCDEFAVTIHDLCVQLADAGVIENMDQAEVEFAKLGVDRKTLAEALVEVTKYRASLNVKRTITNISNVKADARLEKSLRAQLSRLEAELAHLPIDAPISKQKRQRINKEINNLRNEIAKTREKVKDQKHHERRIAQVTKSIERLDTQIADLESITGDFSKIPPAQRPKEAAEIEKLKAKRAELAREKDLTEQIVNLEQGKTKPDTAQGTPVTNKRIADLEAKRDELARKKQLEDQIAVLEEKLQTTEFEVPMKAKAKTQSQTLEDLEFQKYVLHKKTQAHIRDLKPVSKVKTGLDNTFGIYKAMRASIDWSMILRQGFRYVVSHPIKAVMQVPGTFEAMISPRFAQEQLKEFENHPLYKEMVKSGLEITDTETNREDEFTQMSLKSKILGPIFRGKASPFAASERAFSHFMNQVRIDSFATMAKSISPNGDLSLEDGKAIARFVNILTGRGDAGKIAQAGDYLNYAFFSYRYTLSNVQFLEDVLLRSWWESFSALKAPTDWASDGIKPPATRKLGSDLARKAIVKEYAKIGGGYVAMMSLVMLWNAIHMDDEDDFYSFFDPTSTDFLKMRIGGRRIDVMGGMGQVVSYLARMGLGGYTDSKGDWQDFADPKFGNQTRGDISSQQFFNKIHPLLGVGGDILRGKTRFGGMQVRDTEGTIWNPANYNVKWVVQEFLPVWSALSVQEGADVLADESMSHEGWMYIGFCLGLGIIGAGGYNPQQDLSNKEKEEMMKRNWYDWQNPN